MEFGREDAIEKRERLAIRTLSPWKYKGSAPHRLTILAWSEDDCSLPNIIIKS